ncbi:MAG TPA: T9SS type A sorting domain-containing protein [Bacteroidia bacterium]|nr:T9SS type A sorting domain-containing protein [Bacteroidia bacterium]
MKRLFTCFGILVSLTTFAQSFSSPESVEYDVAGNRWFVGQNGSGQIHVYSPGSSTLLPFATGLGSGPHGMEVMGSRLYVCDGGYIRGYDLSTGTQTFSINCNASFLNGLTTDGTTYLFATDFSGKKIYRICPSTNTFNIMCTTIKTPNGIYYDGANNRCVFVTWGSNAPVQAMSLADSTVSTLLPTTMGNCDGLTRDAAGYWYVTAWTGNQLWRIDPVFAAAPVSVMTGLSSPADIDINSANDSIGISNNGSLNNVVFYTNITTGINAPSLISAEVFPTPATSEVTIRFAENISDATAELYDMSGKVIRSEAFAGQQYIVKRDALAAGTYLLIFRNDQGVTIASEEILFE